MNKKYILILLCSFLAAIIMPILTNGSFTHYIIALALFLYLALPILLVGSSLYAYGKYINNKTIMKNSKIAILFSFVIALQLMSLPILNKIDSGNIITAKNYCESLLPTINDYKSKHGKYPPKISDIKIPDGIPYFLRGQHFYIGGKDEFSFSFHSPGSFITVYIYSNISNEWTFD